MYACIYIYDGLTHPTFQLKILTVRQFTQVICL